jgi:hypothetical protein
LRVQEKLGASDTFAQNYWLKTDKTVKQVLCRMVVHGALMGIHATHSTRMETDGTFG